MNALTDFTDRLSPMLVKELRQGVRSRIFVYTLLLLQGFLLLLAISGLLATDAQKDTDGVSAFFWIVSGVFLILFLPLGGFKAIGQERTSNTLDLIFLTRLTTRRIVAGKWLAIVAQITLLVFTILPYLVLRYFLGGVDLGAELLVVGSMLLVSAALSAITVGISSLPTVFAAILRVAGLFLGLFLALIVLGRRLAGAFGGGVMMMGGSSLPTWQGGVAAIVEAILLILLMLEFGAARIAPPAENHSSPLRLIGLGGIIAGIILDHAFFRFETSGAILAFSFMLPFLIGALCESPRMIASIYRPFVRRGFLGKAAGRFLYPGWQSAMWYTLLTLSIFGLEIYFQSPARDRGEAVLLTIIITGTLLFPAAVTRLFANRLRYPLAIYIGVQAISALLYSFASILKEFNGPDLRFLLEAIPTCALMGMTFKIPYDLPTAMIVAGAVTTFSVFLLFLLSQSGWREIRTLEKRAELMKDRNGESAPVEAPASVP
jgi:hypothetical protein